MPHILCAGIAVLDEVFRVREFPLPDTKVEASEFITVGGGCAANAAVAIARLGGKVTSSRRSAGRPATMRSAIGSSTVSRRRVSTAADACASREPAPRFRRSSSTRGATAPSPPIATSASTPWRPATLTASSLLSTLCWWTIASPAS